MRQSELIVQRSRIQLADGKGSAQSHRDTRDCKLLQDPETEALNSSIFCFVTSKPFLILRPYLCWRNPLWRSPYPGYTCSDHATVHDEWRVPPRALGRGTNHVSMPVGHTFHTSTSPFSPSRWGSSARAWRLLKSFNCSHAHSFCHLPSWPPGLQVLATPQCLHLKHQFRLWRNTGEKRLPYQDKGQPAGKRASGEQKQSLSSTHCIPRAAPGVWQRNILANTSWLAECYSSP